LLDVIGIRVFHTAISRGLIERYDCKRRILLVGVVCGISGEMEVGVNGSVGFTLTLVAVADGWEH
jgi:hypothetical protein